MRDTVWAMQEWLYRATPAKAKSAETATIVKKFSFIHRSAHTDAAMPQRIANIANVAIDDVIHLYFINESNVGRPFGAYRVVAAGDHPQTALFAAQVPGTALYTVTGDEFRERLRVIGYGPDPKLGEFCGWPVVPGPQGSSPVYTAALFPGRNSLVLRT